MDDLVAVKECEALQHLPNVATGHVLNEGPRRVEDRPERPAGHVLQKDQDFGVILLGVEVLDDVWVMR